MTKPLFISSRPRGALVLGFPLCLALAGCGGGGTATGGNNAFAGNLTGSAVTSVGPDAGKTNTLGVNIDGAGIITFVSTTPGSSSAHITGAVASDGSFVATRAASSGVDAVSITGRVTGTGSSETITGTFVDSTNGDSGTFSVSTGSGGAFAGSFVGNAHITGGPGIGGSFGVSMLVSSTGSFSLVIGGQSLAPIPGTVNADGAFVATVPAGTGRDALAIAGKLTGTGASERGTATFTDYTNGNLGTFTLQ